MNRISIGCGAAAALLLCGPASADITISASATRNMSCTAGVCAPTASNAVLNVNDLENLLAAGNVEVTTTGAGVEAGNIDASANLSWSAATLLTLDAYQSLTFASSVNVTGAGGLVLLSNDSGGGALVFAPGGNIAFQNLSSPLSINGNVYTLVNSIASLAQTGGAGFIALAQSYDASQDGIYSISPVPTLSGAFEGLGNTISNFSLTDGNPEYKGLFSEIASMGSVSDLGLANANITSTDQTNLGAGALAGSSGGQITNVWSSGAVAAARDSAGGLIGETNGGSITNSASSATVTAGVNGGGGLAGEVSETSVDNSYATGEVNSSTATWVGGLLGSAEESTVQQSFASGYVKGKGNSYGGSFAGGLIGITLSGAKVENSYATGKVSGGIFSQVGGLIGEMYKGGRFLTSYSTGAVSGAKGCSVGGFVGFIEQDFSPVFQDAYWDTDGSGDAQGTGNQGNLSGLTGLTTAQFQSGLPAGFSANIWAEGADVQHHSRRHGNGGRHTGGNIIPGLPWLIGNRLAQ